MSEVNDQQKEEQYIEDLYGKDQLLEEVKISIREQGMPEISIAEGYGRLLTVLVASTKASHVLEIGVLGGYSSICLARGLSDEGKLVSLELNPDYAALANKNISQAGLESKFSVMVGEALISLEQLAQQNCRFDLFFIDADKGNYPTYLEWVIRLAKPGALIIADNLWLRGRTLNQEKNGPAVCAMREFNTLIAQDKRLISTLIPGYDGLALAYVK